MNTNFHIKKFSSLLYKKIQSSALSKICPKGVFVFHEGEKYHGPWLLHRGTVVLIKSSTTGKEQIVREVEAGEIFAEVPIFKSIDCYPLQARCTTSCELSLLPSIAVIEALKKDPDLAWEAACALAERITDFRDLIFDYTLVEINKRLLRYFLRRLEGKPHATLGMVRLGLSHQDLALLLGIRPESLSRAITDLEQSGKLKRISRQTFQLFLKNIQKEDHAL